MTVKLERIRVSIKNKYAQGDNENKARLHYLAVVVGR